MGYLIDFFKSYGIVYIQKLLYMSDLPVLLIVIVGRSGTIFFSFPYVVSLSKVFSVFFFSYG